MSRPRCIVPGSTYLITRRCSERRFLLVPDSAVNRCFRFCLARAAARTGVQLHAYLAMSNHYHLVLTDPDGRLPEFQHWLDTYVAKFVNSHRGRWESFWAPGSYSAVRLVDTADVNEKLLYLFLNPVSAGLVSRLDQWPGAHSSPASLGQSDVVDRPTGYFRESGPVPERCRLELVCPEGIEATQLQSELHDREARLRREAKDRGDGFVGKRRVLRQSPSDAPRRPAPRRDLNPRIAAREVLARVAALKEWKAFLDAYRDARAAFSNGDRRAVFPYGTYLMRVRWRVACAGP